MRGLFSVGLPADRMARDLQVLTHRRHSSVDLSDQQCSHFPSCSFVDAFDTHSIDESQRTDGHARCLRRSAYSFESPWSPSSSAYARHDLYFSWWLDASVHCPLASDSHSHRSESFSYVGSLVRISVALWHNRSSSLQSWSERLPLQDFLSTALTADECSTWWINLFLFTTTLMDLLPFHNRIFLEQGHSDWIKRKARHAILIIGPFGRSAERRLILKSPMNFTDLLHSPPTV